MIGRDWAAHRETQMLMPWYVTGQLDEADRHLVSGHLADCAECREALAAEHAIEQDVASLPTGAELGWNELSRRIAGKSAPSSHFAGASPARRRRWTALAIAAQFLVLITAVVAFAPLGRPASYHVLGAAPATASGNAIMMFRQDTSTAEMMRVLNAAGTRIVDGPTASGAWIVRMDPGRRTGLIARLRAQSAVAMAEPIDR